MKSKIIKIGNSRGVRLPKALLEELGPSEEVVLEATRGTIVIRPVKSPRSGWKEVFQDMTRRGDDTLGELDAYSSSWDDEEWEWK